jgi:hypothetical protein
VRTSIFSSCHSSLSQIGQFVPELYSRYFDLTPEKAEQDVENRVAASKSIVAGRANTRTGKGSWFHHQMQRVKGNLTRAKGHQLAAHVTLDHLRKMHAFQKHSDHYSGATIYLSKGGVKSPYAACVELADDRGAFKLEGMWLARAFTQAPLAVRRDFLTYWGVQGHTYVAYLQIRKDGSCWDPYADKSLEISASAGSERADSSETRESESLDLGGSAGPGGAGERTEAEIAQQEGQSERAAGVLGSQGKEGCAEPPTSPVAVPDGGFHGSWRTAGGELVDTSLIPTSTSTRYRRQGLNLADAAPSMDALVAGDMLLPGPGVPRVPVLLRMEEAAREELPGECMSHLSPHCTKKSEAQVHGAAKCFRTATHARAAVLKQGL